MLLRSASTPILNSLTPHTAKESCPEPDSISQFRRTRPIMLAATSSGSLSPVNHDYSAKRMSRASSESNLRDLAVPKKKHPLMGFLDGIAVEEEEMDLGGVAVEEDGGLNIGSLDGILLGSGLDSQCDVGGGSDGGGRICGGGGGSNGGDGGDGGFGDEWENGRRNESLEAFYKFRSLVDFAAFQLCECHPIYAPMSLKCKREIFDRCGGNWKRLLRFLQSVEQSSDMVKTSAGNMQVTTGRYHTLLLHKSSVYSCGSSLSGVLGHSAEITQCVAFTPISFPYPAHVLQVSASHNHAAFVMQSGEVFTCGDNSSYCCGHRDTARPVFRPRLVEALREVPCNQVAAGLSFTVFLTRHGHVYSCGSNTCGQLGHGDTLERPTPKLIEQFESVGPVAQIAAGPSYVLAVTESGAVYSFGSGQNFCLGHGEQHNELQPRQVQSFRRRGIHVVRVSAGDEHAVALDSNGLVYTWGKGYCGALGHGDEIDKTTPELIDTLKSHIAVQVCARKRKTFVLVEQGFVYGFGWMGFGSLGFPDRGASDKVLRPRILECLRNHRISQISTGLYHTVAITSTGRMFGFGDNERAQLGHDMLRGCLEPTEIFIQQMGEDDTGMVAESVGA